MKKITIALSALVFLAACGDSAKTSGEAGEVKGASAEAVSLTVDKAASSVRWEGSKMTTDVHHGNISISEGTLAVKGGKLETGSFTLDMNSITNADITDTGYRAKLIGHLKSGDFFQTDSFPTAKFEITGVEAMATPDSSKISGNLTIKGISKGISFPARVSVSDSTAEANASFTINREDWGIIWGGNKTEQSVKDFLKNNLIKNEVNFTVNLKAAK